MFSQGNMDTISVYVCVKTHLSLCLPSPSLLESFSIKIWLKREESEQGMEARNDRNSNGQCPLQRNQDWKQTRRGNFTIMRF